MRPSALAVLAIMIMLPLPTLADDPVWEETGALRATNDLALTGRGAIKDLVSPTIGAPVIIREAGSFAAEFAIAPDVGIAGVELDNAALGCDAAASLGDMGATKVWADQPDRVVRHATITVDAACPRGLYDLVVRFLMPVPGGVYGWSDAQPNAVSIMDGARWDALAAGTAEPRFVVIADPQIGDPRAFADGATESQTEGSLHPMIIRADGVIGDGTAGKDGRWRAFQAVIDAVNAVEPDFVLVAGDLAFSQLVPGSYDYEYAEIHRVMQQFTVPTFLAPGNHDGYMASGQDGFAYWNAFIGPAYFAREATPGTHVLVLNTYDWSEMDRMGFSLAVSAWGGQVRSSQLAWIAATLGDIRAADAGARILSVAHHSPSWVQDAYAAEDPSGITAGAQGSPVAEQVSRGAVSVATTDQGWSGINRLPLRDLLRANDVEIHFAGHTHRDRVARDDGTGRIIETFQTDHGRGPDYDPRDLHYVNRDDTLVTGHSQDALAALMRTGAGPLYVETTTSMSDTTQYWGYRDVRLAYDGAGDLDLAGIGYALTQQEFDDLVAKPGIFNPAHASLGLFSTPLNLPLAGAYEVLGDVLP